MPLLSEMSPKVEVLLVAPGTWTISDLHEILYTLNIFLVLLRNNHAYGFGIILREFKRLTI